MIEKTVIDYLSEIYTNVYAEKPVNPPSSYIIVEKTGESEENKVFTATIAVQVIRPSLYEAASDCTEIVYKMLELFPYSSGVFSCKLVSNYNFTDPRTKENRYQAVFTITH